MKNLFFILKVIFTLHFVYSQENTMTHTKYRFIGELAPNIMLNDGDETQVNADFNLINSMEFPSKNTLGFGIGTTTDFENYVFVPVFVDARIKLIKNNNYASPLIILSGGPVVYDKNDGYKRYGFLKIGLGVETKGTAKKPFQFYVGYKKTFQDVFDNYNYGYYGPTSMNVKKGSVSHINLNFALKF